MLNLIANSCVNADIYKKILKCPYPNPFCWQLMDDDSMFNLINEYNTINFNNYKLIKNDNGKYTIIIDNKIKVYYVHYHYSKDDIVIRKNCSDVFYNKIKDYIIQKYEERTKRFLQNKENPIFIIGSTYEDKFCSIETIKKMLKLKTDYKIIFVIRDDCKIDFKLPINFITYKTDIYHDNPKLGKELYDKILSKF